ncbi:F-box domain-containing protein [Apiospora sp. TS-2023a]
MAAAVSSNAEDVVSRLGYVPESMLKCEIPALYSKPPRVRHWPLRPRDSSLGRLDKFPPEVMLMIIKQLDLRSITNIQSVSFQGDAYVRSCTEYRDLLTHVPRALEALGSLGLNRSHRVVDIHHVLQTEACTTCGDRGPFLFLPTCERCCKACLEYYPSFRLIKPSQAMRYFGLSKEHCRHLLAIHLPDRLGSRCCLSHLGPKAVSAKAARDFALAVYGSEKALAQAVKRKNIYFPGWKYWHEAHREPPRRYGLAKMPAMPFPTLPKLPSAKLEMGLWCRGCDFAKDMVPRYTVWNVTDEEIEAMLPLELLTGEYRYSATRVLMDFADRAWSRDTFLEHVRHCPGAQRLIAQSVQ